jgi:hypothetical protein
MLSSDFIILDPFLKSRRFGERTVLQAQGFSFSLAAHKGHDSRYYSSERTEDVKGNH